MSLQFFQGCKENEKNKGCLCVTPSAGDHKREVNIENKEQSENENEEKNPKTNRQNSEQSKILKKLKFKLKMIIQRSWLKSAQTVAIIYSFENSYN